MVLDKHRSSSWCDPDGLIYFTQSTQSVKPERTAFPESV
jgi:hypothetical protein